MRRKTYLFIALAMSACLMCGCGNKSEQAAEETQSATEDTQTSEASEQETDNQTAEDKNSAADNSSNENNDADTGADDTQAESVSDAKTIEPLPSGYDMNNLSDCTIAVSFTTDDFNWMGGTLKAECYETLLYDAVDVSMLNVGDSIEVNGVNTLIRTLTDNDMGRVINEGEDDEIILSPGDGGTYSIWGLDDTSEMADLGQKELILSQNVMLYDCGDNPTDDPIEVGSDKIKMYLEELSDSRKNFTYLDTKILLENGEVTEIRRSWRP